MKKIIMIAILLLLITGCSNQTIDEVKDNNFDNVDEYLGISYEEKSEIKCDELKNVKYMSDTLFITDNNIVYRYGAGMLFSNNQNCKSIELDNSSSYNFKTGISVSNIVGLNDTEFIDDKMIGYRYLPENDLNKFYAYGSYSYLISKFDEWYITFPYIIVKDDNKYFVIKENGDNYIQQEVQTYFDDDEKILSVNGGVVKTNKKFYLVTSTKTNEEECKKYEDIKCDFTYSIQPNELLNKIESKVKIAYSSGYNEINQIYVLANNNYLYTFNI